MAQDRLTYSDGSLVLLSDGSYVLLSTTTPDASQPSTITFRGADKSAAFVTTSKASAFATTSKASAPTAPSRAATFQGRYAITHSSPDQSVIGAE